MWSGKYITGVVTVLNKCLFNRFFNLSILFRLEFNIVIATTHPISVHTNSSHFTRFATLNDYQEGKRINCKQLKNRSQIWLITIEFATRPNGREIDPTKHHYFMLALAVTFSSSTCILVVSYSDLFSFFASASLCTSPFELLFFKHIPNWPCIYPFEVLKFGKLPKKGENYQIVNSFDLLKIRTVSHNFLKP